MEVASEVRVVELTRTNEKGSKGTFGFSVSGGAGTKLPVVVWEVTPGLPADLSKEVWLPNYNDYLHSLHVYSLYSTSLWPTYVQ